MSVSSYAAPPAAAERSPCVPGDRVAVARCLLTDLLAREHPRLAEAIRRVGADWLKRQGLAPLAWHVSGGRDLTPDLAASLRAAHFAALADDLLHRHELQDVLRTLAAQDIVPVAFKGAALAYTVYPDSVCRPMGDLDLWMAARDLPRARSALEQRGYRFYSNPDRPPALKQLHGDEIQLTGQTPGTGLIELHGGVFVGSWLYLTACVNETAVWARTTAVTLLDQPARLLAPEDAVLQLLVHLGINHQYSMSALRGLADVVLLARSTSLPWTAVADRARAWRIATVTWLGLSLAADLAGLSEVQAILPQLAPSRWRRSLLQRLVNAERLVTQTDLRVSRWRYALLLLLVDRPRDVVKLIFRTLWPEREWLIARYGRYTFTTRLRHLLDAARGRI
jgi:hypothetical protein